MGRKWPRSEPAKSPPDQSSYKWQTRCRARTIEAKHRCLVKRLGGNKKDTYRRNQTNATRYTGDRSFRARQGLLVLDPFPTEKITAHKIPSHLSPKVCVQFHRGYNAKRGLDTTRNTGLPYLAPSITDARDERKLQSPQKQTLPWRTAAQQISRIELCGCVTLTHSSAEHLQNRAQW